MSEIWPGHDIEKWEGEFEYGCATSQFHYFILLAIANVLSIVLGVCTAILLCRLY